MDTFEAPAGWGRFARVKPFLDEDFLLENRTAAWLYHEVAVGQPIIDYHCHLPPAEIAANHRFPDLFSIWLAGDHYKWRAMRACGAAERFCTGDASPWEKFEAWAAVVPQTLRNPLYHWTHLELRDPFAVDVAGGMHLSPATARAIWDHCNARLATDAFRTQGLLAHFHVKAVCTTDDPTDTLEHHARHAAAGATATRLYPTFRPDRVLMLDDLEEWNAWVDKLAQAARVRITRLDDLRAALAQRHEFFHLHGCRLSDHGLDTAYADDYTETELTQAFGRARGNERLTPEQVSKFRSAMLHELAVLDHQRGWVQQFHFGALRSANSRALATLGRDTGFDSIGDQPIAVPLARFLDRLNSGGTLTKTILYNLNPRDNAVFATMIGNFQDGVTAGKMQFGSGWWFLDQKDGIERQLDDLSNLGILSRFVGMLTDSRSFLSYSRHEYFRRVLCNRLGDEVERGLVPNDRELLAAMVKAICFDNARDYFNLPLGHA